MKQVKPENEAENKLVPDPKPMDGSTSPLNLHTNTQRSGLGLEINFSLISFFKAGIRPSYTVPLNSIRTFDENQLGSGPWIRPRGTTITTRRLLRRAPGSPCLTRMLWCHMTERQGSGRTPSGLYLKPSDLRLDRSGPEVELFGSVCGFYWEFSLQLLFTCRGFDIM